MIIYTYENKLDSFEYIIHFTQGLNKNQFFCIPWRFKIFGAIINYIYHLITEAFHVSLFMFMIQCVAGLTLRWSVCVRFVPTLASGWVLYNSKVSLTSYFKQVLLT